MIKHNYWYWLQATKILDVFIIAISYVVARGWFIGKVPNFAAEGLWLSILLVAIAWLVISRAFDVDRSKRLFSYRDEIKSITAAMVTLLIFLAALSNIDFRGFLSVNIPLFILLSWIGIVFSHGLLRVFLRSVRSRGFNQRKALIFGASGTGKQLADDFVSRPWAGIQVIGFVDDDPKLQGTQVKCAGKSFSVIGRGDELRQIIVSKKIDELFIILSSSSYDHLSRDISDIADLNVNVRIVPDLFGVAFARAHVEDLWGTPLVGLRQSQIYGLDALIKRSVDIAVSTIVLLLVAPLLMFIMLIIRLDSKGSPLFIQKRVGRNGEIFNMYKFRSMAQDAEKRLNEVVNLDQIEQPMFKIKNDPRITRVGRVLRKSSLDEVPQFVNVLNGSMSLVGPRPEEVKIVSMYSPEQRQRLAMKPGITGPMQVNGRGDLPFDERLNLELEYIRNYSLLMDFEIMLRTIPAVLLGKGVH